jgi:hypothetical protein
MPAGFFCPAKTKGNKKADPVMGRLDNNPEGLLLAASFFQHAQSTLVSFVSSLLCFFEQQPELHQLYGRLRLHELGRELLRLQ